MKTPKRARSVGAAIPHPPIGVLSNGDQGLPYVPAISSSKGFSCCTVPGWVESLMGFEESVALLAARTRPHEPSRCQSILPVMLLDARSSPAARARRNRSAHWHQRTSAQTLSATTRWLPHVDVTSNIERRTTLARGTKPVPTAEATAMQRCSCSCSRQQLQHLAAAVAMDGAPPWKAPGCE